MYLMLVNAMNELKRKLKILNLKFKYTPKQALISKELWYIFYKTVEIAYYSSYLFLVFIPFTHNIITNDWTSSKSLEYFLAKNPGWFHYFFFLMFNLALAYFTSAYSFVFEIYDGGVATPGQDAISDIIKYYVLFVIGGSFAVETFEQYIPSGTLISDILPLLITTYTVRKALKAEKLYSDYLAYLRRCRG